MSGIIKRPTLKNTDTVCSSLYSVNVVPGRSCHKTHRFLQLSTTSFNHFCCINAPQVFPLVLQNYSQAVCNLILIMNTLQPRINYCSVFVTNESILFCMVLKSKNKMSLCHLICIQVMPLVFIGSVLYSSHLFPHMSYVCFRDTTHQMNSSNVSHLHL